VVDVTSKNIKNKNQIEGFFSSLADMALEAAVVGDLSVTKATTMPSNDSAAT
jgi:hypothetical protein